MFWRKAKGIRNIKLASLPKFFQKKRGWGGTHVSDYGLRIDKFLLPININNQILKNQTGFFVKKNPIRNPKIFQKPAKKKGGEWGRVQKTDALTKAILNFYVKIIRAHVSKTFWGLPSLGKNLLQIFNITFCAHMPKICYKV